jgi:CRP-like cAMP-binding protein
MKMSPRRARLSRTEELLATTEPLAVEPPTSATVAQLRDAPLFAGLDAEAVAAAMETFEEVHFLPGHRIVVEGLRGSEFYLIVAGRASVLVDSWRVADLHPGDFFGEIAVLGDGLRSASVRAETPLHCVVLPNGRLEQLLLDQPRLGVNLLRALAARLQNVGGRRQPPASEFGA